MPIYEFQCDRCDHVFERLQKLSDTDPDTCPVCSEQAIRRRLTAPAFRLAGSGWYETDFKKDGDNKRNLVEKSDAPAEAKSGEAAESKPTAKPDASASPKADTGSSSKPDAKAKTAPPASKPPASSPSPKPEAD
ncbi:MAG: zinc ribbon domain-containing protein [Lysobacteraceae bacterium]